jgi:hypothetical protein
MSLGMHRRCMAVGDSGDRNADEAKAGEPSGATPPTADAHSTQGLAPLGATPASKYDFDLIVVGSGPAAQGCAISSSRRGKKVAVVDRPSMLGGVCVNTGTIPSKTFREAVLHLSGE